METEHRSVNVRRAGKVGVLLPKSEIQLHLDLVHMQLRFPHLRRFRGTAETLVEENKSCPSFGPGL